MAYSTDAAVCSVSGCFGGAISVAISASEQLRPEPHPAACHYNFYIKLTSLALTWY